MDQRCVVYTAEFMKELNNLLDGDIKDEAQWTKLTNKYGQFYISQCEIGGVAFSTKEEEIKKSESKDAKKKDFEASFEATVYPGASVGASAGGGSSSNKGNKSMNTSSNMRLEARGGDTSLCSANKFDEWEKSVGMNYKKWEVINVLQVQPFYQLLSLEKQKKIGQLMPKSKKIDIKEKQPQKRKEVITTRRVGISRGCFERFKYVIYDLLFDRNRK